LNRTTGYVREESLDLQISDLLKPYALRADWADEMLELVKKEKRRLPSPQFMI
jgi:hypothetical protein